MTRVSKHPTERRDELLDVALRLCTEVGYDALSIDQITAAAGVAKGTFYYYFQTKQSMLIDLVDRFADDLFVNLEDLAASAGGTGEEQFRTMMQNATVWKTERLSDSMAFIPLLYKPENLELRHRLFEAWTSRIWHLFHPMVAAGKADGSFHLDDAEATTDLVLSIWVDGSTRMYDRALAEPTEEGFVDTVVRGIAALTAAVERILGAAPGSFAVDVDPGVLRVMRDPFLAALHGATAPAPIPTPARSNP